MAKKKRSSSAKVLGEKTWFIPDTAASDPDRNTALAGLLNATWNPLALVRVERIEIGPDKGWRATYRE